MDPRFLEFKPTRYFCPYCGEWHIVDEDIHELNYYDSEDFKARLACTHYEIDKTIYFFKDGHCYYKTISSCERAGFDICGSIPIENIIESADEPRVTFSVPFIAQELVNFDTCSSCSAKDSCLACKLGEETGSREMNITFGFEFEQSDYDKFSKSSRLRCKEKELQEREQAVNNKEQDLKEREQAINSKEQELREQEESMVTNTNLQVQENKEGITMKEKATGIWEQLYEHSPKENVEIAKQWAEKYKPTLRWVVPVVSIYAAYRILNSKDSNINVNNINKISKKSLGFEFDNLKDKEVLKELLVVGGLTAGAYAAIKGISAVYSKNNAKDLSIEQIEEGMDKLDGASKKFGFIQPKTEKMLPIALSVITVYVMTQKPKQLESITEKVKQLTGNFGTKAKVYAEMLKLFIADRLHVDLDNEEESKKVKRFAFLAAILGISVMLYGKKVLGSKAEVSEEEEKEPENTGMQVFAEQVLSIMEKIMPTVFAGLTTWLVSKRFLKPDEIVDADYTEETES